MINVTVVYALPENATIIDCQIENGCNVQQAITQSNILARCNITLDNLKVGIYGKFVGLTDLIKNSDRIEIYRPLINDPKSIRLKRANQNKNSG